MLPEQCTGNNLQWEQWTENKKEARTLHGNTPYPPPCNGAYDQDLNRLDKVHIRAMRIITGATQRSSTQALYGELGWHTLAQRGTIHRLRLFYEIKYNLAPSYLSQLMPQTAHERNPSVLRNPNTTRYWNSLPLEIRQAPTLCSFNRMLGAHISPPPRRAWYVCDKCVLDIYHTRLRLGCSGLKVHLHYNLHVEDDPYCRCGRVIEDPAYYLFPRSAHTSLTWDNTNSYSLIRYNFIWRRDLIRIALLVQTFIETTKRFK